jgi:hypothetical protein
MITIIAVNVVFCFAVVVAIVAGLASSIFTVRHNDGQRQPQPAGAPASARPRRLAIA